ncbi:Cys-tRNA(Pro) deacylase [Janthinobacterium sp. B9-8]|uniref:Cys-tRNA(Pro) deacylase n=1 Tax=Janthinobacterium sp. B9-8 TaxID=1236179 RepID=UPI00061D30EC|nr:Cys-tRNA(Pro) deacylase [Janthinobacterium sp. B9-8]AMC33969.1 aminoacyl-tRNA deacylase [Janthinobacterium sp. B9-8]
MSEKTPVTQAIRTLRQHDVAYVECLYAYEEKGGTAVSAQALGVSEHQVIKTLIMEDEKKQPMIVLMHGDCEVSTKNLARHLKVKHIVPCQPEVANRHSGYMVGGTSPFGTKRAMPVYMQESIAHLGLIYINGGKRGFLVRLEAKEAVRVLQPVLLDMANPHEMAKSTGSD